MPSLFLLIALWRKQKGRPEAAFGISGNRSKSARIEFDDQMRLHLDREGHFRKIRNARDLRILDDKENAPQPAC